jgi:hypothetical protein
MNTELEDLDDESSSDPTHLSTTIAVNGSNGFVMWPHCFTRWAQKYKPPDHFLLTLLFLWDTTVNHKMRGRLALSQIPVRQQYAMKWLAAFEMCGFFTVVKAGPRDLKGSLYEYKPDTDPDQWEALFEWAAWITEATGPRSWDEVSPTDFGRLAQAAREQRAPLMKSRFLHRRDAEQHSAINNTVAAVRKFLRGAK